MPTLRDQTPVLIVGAGAAGLTCALRCAEYTDVVVLAKGSGPDGATAYAQGGIAAACLPSDSCDQHVQDTLNAGAGLNTVSVVERIIAQAPACIQWLSEQGVPFVTSSDDQWALGLEGGHQQARIVHVADRTGWAISQTLREKVQAHPRIRLIESHMAIDLIVREGRCVGAYVMGPDAQISTWQAAAVVLATGGFSWAYLHATHSHVASGDGAAMAFRAGCRLADLEFNQFHPTCLYHPGHPPLLLTEALRGEGAHLLLPDGHRFMDRFDPQLELAPRDRVARAIDYEMKRLGVDHLYLDISHRPAEWIQTRFPSLYQACLKAGFDMTQVPLPVVPAAHYTCGGVWVDDQGQTDLLRLYAIGETACNGLHGANRLASNALLDCVVTAGEVAAHIKTLDLSHTDANALPLWDLSRVCSASEAVMVMHNWHELRATLWDYVGIVRSDDRLAKAQARIQLCQNECNQYYGQYHLTPDLVEYRNLVHMATLIIQSAQFRRESRGLHYNRDCPDLDTALNGRHTWIQKDWKGPRYSSALEGD